MRSAPTKVVEDGRIKTGPQRSSSDLGCCGRFEFRGPRRRTLLVIADNGMPETEPFGGWEHVSVSLLDFPGRTPNWTEVCFVKDQFWKEEEVVVQYHPRRSEYVNVHPGVLHLWRRVDGEFPTPPTVLV